jgi:hypothetical protein
LPLACAPAGFGAGWPASDTVFELIGAPPFSSGLEIVAVFWMVQPTVLVTETVNVTLPLVWAGTVPIDHVSVAVAPAPGEQPPVHETNCVPAGIGSVITTLCASAFPVFEYASV